MEGITKVFFDPLATTKAQIRAIIEELPVGSAHPFSPEQVLLHRTATGIVEINISSYPEEYFFNAVDLGELGQILQTRMTKFPTQLRLFNDEYTVQQAPKSTFRVPIESDKIAILAVSERYPSYYDLCVADAQCKTSCWAARTSFTGLAHSGDINVGQDLLHHITIKEQLQSDKEFTVFVAGYTCTKLFRYKARNPVVMIANHAEKALYIIPVPLDAASIGDATICCPVAFKREENMLICSILPTPTTDLNKYCSDSFLQSTSFNKAIQRADWTISAPPGEQISRATPMDTKENIIPVISSNLEALSLVSAKHNAVFVMETTVLPALIAPDTTQIIRFGAGLEFLYGIEEKLPESSLSTVVLPCIFGSRLQGPLLLAVGKSPKNVPFPDDDSLRAFYEKFENAVIFVDERMTDNARNLATPWRINAVFIIQMALSNPPKDGNVEALLNLVNINAVTALAGPQSLVLVQIGEKYFFYRGLANPVRLNTTSTSFGQEVTEAVEATGLKSLLDPMAKRLVNLSEANTVLLQKSRQYAQPTDLKGLFENLSVANIQELENDISPIIPQLQVLLSQQALVNLSKDLIEVLSKKVHDEIAPLREAYIDFFKNQYNMADPESVKKKNTMLSKLRKHTNDLQKVLESTISHLSNMMSSQMTSKRTHDLKRLERQATIQSNVESVKSMTFDTLAGLLETKAADMGVLLLNIETTPYKQLLGNLRSNALDANSCCNLDSRTLFLEGFDAGIIMEQSQSSHDGPLKHQLGVSHPTLALPYLSKERGSGSMLAWVCWDEFVNLETPFKVRWMEKCNEAHVAALRIIMRETLSQSVASREHNMQPGSQETGQLMSALLMAAMSKLAALKVTAPVRTISAEDTVTKLMRGLFGNLLTIAGSGTRPLSMVWQLFGQEPRFEVPGSAVAWSWYETVVRLYPFSGWPQGKFKLNLGKLLDKALIAVVTKNEMTENLKTSRAEWMAKYCTLRNIQLEHSRTIVTIFMQMMNKEAGRSEIATRLLAALPSRLDKQTKSYSMMLRYLRYMAETGLRREEDDVVIVNVYLKRSAVFKTLKRAAGKACRSGDDAEIKRCCEELLKKFNDIAESWELQHAKLIMQNAKAFQGLLDTHPKEGTQIDDATRTQRKKCMLQVMSDAEKVRTPWQVGKPSEVGDIEPLDEAFIYEMMTGETAPELALTKQNGPGTQVQMTQFSSIVSPEFISKMDSVATLEDVCKTTNIPVSAMLVFASALNSKFDCKKDLATNFKQVVVSLLMNRKEREKQRPTQALFDMEHKTLEE